MVSVLIALIIIRYIKIIYTPCYKIIKLKAFKEGNGVLVQVDMVTDREDLKYLMGGKITRILGNDTMRYKKWGIHERIGALNKRGII